MKKIIIFLITIIGFQTLLSYQGKAIGEFSFYEGEYIKQDINKALYYFNKSADLNNIAAQRNLGFVYKNNYYGKKDILCRPSPREDPLWC